MSCCILSEIKLTTTTCKRQRKYEIETPKELSNQQKTNQLGHSKLVLIHSLLKVIHWDLRWKGHNFADDIFKCIFLNENCCILIKISLKFVTKGPINNIPELVQIMAWHQPGDKPLSEPMMVIGIDHDTVCAGVVGTAIRHSTSCAGVRRYFHPHDIFTPGWKYRYDIFTPSAIFSPPHYK